MLQQAGQAKAKEKLERDKLEQRYSEATAKVQAKMAEEAEKAANDKLLLQAYAEKQAANAQMGPLERRQSERQEIIGQVTDPAVAKKISDVWTQQDEEEQYLEGAQKTQQHIDLLEQDEVLSPDEAASARMELEQRVSRRGDVSGVTRALAEKSEEHTAAEVLRRDWDEVIKFGQEALQNIPDSPEKQEIKSQLVAFETKQSAREGINPFTIKAQLEAMLSGPAPGIYGQKPFEMTGRQFQQARGGGQQGAPAPAVQGQTPTESRENAARGFPGADPGGGHKLDKKTMARLLGIEEPAKKKKRKTTTHLETSEIFPIAGQ
jgi:hypothetical protein